MYLRTSSVIGMLLGIACGLLLSSEALALRSAMTGVKFGEVELSLLTLPQYEERLSERAFQALSKAGLTPQRQIDRRLVEEGRAYILMITLYPRPIDGCPDHYSYAHRNQHELAVDHHGIWSVRGIIVAMVVTGAFPAPPTTVESVTLPPTVK